MLPKRMSSLADEIRAKAEAESVKPQVIKKVKTERKSVKVGKVEKPKKVIKNKRK